MGEEDREIERCGLAEGGEVMRSYERSRGTTLFSRDTDIAGIIDV